MQQIEIDQDQTPLSFKLGANLFAQPVDQVEWSALFNGSVNWDIDVNPTTTVSLEAGAFARVLSLAPEDPDSTREGLDSDVYTGFKNDHRHGLQGSVSVAHYPWDDLRLWAEAGFMTNEDLDPTDPDNVRFELGVRQLLGDWSVTGIYRHREYFADADRSARAQRDFVGLGVSLNGWADADSGYQVDAEVGYRPDLDDFSAALRLTWRFGSGYRAYMPGEVPFRRIRERQRNEHASKGLRDAGR